MTGNCQILNYQTKKKTVVTYFTVKLSEEYSAENLNACATPSIPQLLVLSKETINYAWFNSICY